MHGRNSKGARFRSLSGVVSAQTQQMRYFSSSRINCGRCQPACRNSMANRNSRGNCARNLRSACFPSAGVSEGGSCTRITCSFGPSDSIVRKNEVSSAAQSRRRQIWVIWRGSLHVNRNVAGVISAQRRTVVSPGVAWKVESTSTAGKWPA